MFKVLRRFWDLQQIKMIFFKYIKFVKLCKLKQYFRDFKFM